MIIKQIKMLSATILIGVLNDNTNTTFNIPSGFVPVPKPQLTVKVSKLSDMNQKALQ